MRHILPILVSFLFLICLSAKFRKCLTWRKRLVGYVLFLKCWWLSADDLRISIICLIISGAPHRRGHAHCRLAVGRARGQRSAHRTMTQCSWVWWGREAAGSRICPQPCHTLFQSISNPQTFIDPFHSVLSTIFNQIPLLPFTLTVVLEHTLRNE